MKETTDQDNIKPQMLHNDVKYLIDMRCQNTKSQRDLVLQISILEATILTFVVPTVQTHLKGLYPEIFLTLAVLFLVVGISFNVIRLAKVFIAENVDLTNQINLVQDFVSNRLDGQSQAQLETRLKETFPDKGKRKPKIYWTIALLITPLVFITISLTWNTVFDVFNPQMEPIGKLQYPPFRHTCQIYHEP